MTCIATGSSRRRSEFEAIICYSQVTAVFCTKQYSVTVPNVSLLAAV